MSDRQQHVWATVSLEVFQMTALELRLLGVPEVRLDGKTVVLTRGVP